MTPERTLRVVTYNVRGLRDDRAAVIRVVRAAQPDIVCFQEAPRGALWRQRCGALARDADLLYVAGGRPAAGNMLAVAARVDVLGVRDAMLSPSSTPGRQRELEHRGISTALLRVGGVRLGLIGIHAGLSARERARHAAEILGVAERLRAGGAAGVIVAGDLNAAPDRPEWNAMTARLTDAYAAAPSGAELTFPAIAPRHRIDVVFVEPPIGVVSCGAYDHPDVALASDHWPVLAVLRVPPRSAHR